MTRQALGSVTVALPITGRSNTMTDVKWKTVTDQELNDYIVAVKMRQEADAAIERRAGRDAVRFGVIRSAVTDHGFGLMAEFADGTRVLLPGWFESIATAKRYAAMLQVEAHMPDDGDFLAAMILANNSISVEDWTP